MTALSGNRRRWMPLVGHGAGCIQGALSERMTAELNRTLMPVVSIGHRNTS
jgi:hypothetical protein